MTIAWLVVWLVADLTGGSVPLHFDPVDGWTGTLLLAVAIDLNRPRIGGGVGR